jgi:hypothetical protein
MPITYYLVDIADDFVYTWGSFKFVSQVMDEAYAGLTILTEEELTSNMKEQVLKELSSQQLD